MTWNKVAICQCLDNQGTIADALTWWELNRRINMIYTLSGPQHIVKLNKLLSMQMYKQKPDDPTFDTALFVLTDKKQ